MQRYRFGADIVDFTFKWHKFIHRLKSNSRKHFNETRSFYIYPINKQKQNVLRVNSRWDNWDNIFTNVWVSRQSDDRQRKTCLFGTAPKSNTTQHNRTGNKIVRQKSSLFFLFTFFFNFSSRQASQAHKKLFFRHSNECQE